MDKNKTAILIVAVLLMLLHPFGFSPVESLLTIPPPPYNVDAIAIWSHNSTDPLLGRDIYYSIYDDSNGFWWTMEPPYVGMASPIAKLDGDDLFPAIAFDHNGRAITVWSHDTMTDSLLFDIFYSCWDPWFFKWSDPAPVAKTFGNDWDPTITLWIDGTDGLVVWTRENGELWYLQWDGKTWIGPVAPLVDPWPPLYPGYLKQPEIAYDTNHNAIVVWTDSDEEPPYMFRVWYSVHPYFVPDHKWSYPQPIPNQAYDDVARSYRKGISAGTVGTSLTKVVWGPEYEFAWPIQYALWNGSAFRYVSNVTDDTLGIESAIAFDRANNAITTYRSDRLCRQGDIWYNREVAGVWLPPDFAAGTEDSGIAMNDDEPRTAFMLSGRAVAVWTAYYADTEIYYSIWKPPGFWTKPASIASAIKHLPGDDGLWDGPVAIASNSGSPTAPLPPLPIYLRVDAIAVCSHDTGNSTNLFDIYYSLYNDELGIWWTLEGTQAAPIASLTGNDTSPAISFDHHGRAIAVWSHETGGGYHDIYYSCWRSFPFIGWSPPAPVAETPFIDDLDPAIAVWKDGNEALAIWVSFIPKGIPELWWSRWNGTHWVGPAEAITSPFPWPSELAVMDKKPEIAYDANRNVIAIWTEVGACEYNRVFYSVYPVIGPCPWWWPTQIPKQNVMGNVVNGKAISPDRLGNTKAVWGVDTCWRIQYTVWNGTAFSPPSNITEAIDIQSEPAVAFDQFDNATLVYHSMQICWDDIWYSLEVGRKWSTPSFAAGADGSFIADMDPRIAHIICGRALAVWTASHWESPHNEMYYSIWDPTLNWTDAMPIVSAGLPLADIEVAVASNLGSPTTPILVHDVAITNVKPFKTVVGQGFNETVHVNVTNEGDIAETFDVRAFYFPTGIPVFPIVIGTQTITLESGAKTTLTFKWNTKGVPKGNYTIGAGAGPVLGEHDIGDNWFIDGYVIVAMVGDVTGPTPCVPDGKVDIRDIALIARCFGSYIGHPRYIPKCDINCDGKIDIKDIALCARNFGKIDP